WTRRYVEQPGDAEIARLLAQHAALVVAQSLALQAARAAQAEAEAARARSVFLATAGDALASSLDDEATLRQIAELVVPRLADWCTIDLVGDDGLLRRIAARHADPAKQAAVGA